MPPNTASGPSNTAAAAAAANSSSILNGNTIDILKPAPPSAVASNAAASAESLQYQASGTASGSDSCNEYVNAAGVRGASKRPLMTHTKDGKELSEKKLRRLEKNRLSARECRRRKREATEQLQHQINAMEAENLKLRLQLQIGEEAESCIASEQTAVTQDIHNLLESGASEADIYATLEEFKEKYADYGKSRRSSIEFHLRQIERLLQPTQTTTVVMHAIQGGEAAISTNNQESSPLLTGESSNLEDPLKAVSPSSTTVASVSSLHDESSLLPPPPPPPAASADPPTTEAQQQRQPPARLNPKDLFRYLVQYLEVSPQQAAAMKDSRLVAQEMDSYLENSLAVLTELRDRLAQTGEDLETEFNNVRSILTPTQAAKFLVWVANNSACMHMLNELWDRVYPQPPSSNTPDYNSSDDAKPEAT